MDKNKFNELDDIIYNRVFDYLYIKLNFNDIDSKKIDEYIENDDMDSLYNIYDDVEDAISFFRNLDDYVSGDNIFKDIYYMVDKSLNKEEYRLVKNASKLNNNTYKEMLSILVSTSIDKVKDNLEDELYDIESKLFDILEI